MVNYCCVYSCGRNSRTNYSLTYFSLPKEKDRRVLWLKAAGREDLLEDGETKSKNYRFCSRHFTPSAIKNKNLCADAAPSLHLPMSANNEKTEEPEHNPEPHANVVCNICKRPIIGFRYKCVSCNDFDLCQKCESLEKHPHHFMLRIPRPMKFKLVDNLKKKWRELFKSEHVTAAFESDSSDDEPITKYAKNYDSGIDLSEDVKIRIRKEINRVLKLKPEQKRNEATKKRLERKRQVQKVDKPSKRLKFETVTSEEVKTGNDCSAPEVAFADVNDIKEGQILELKPEFSEVPVVVPQASTSDARNCLVIAEDAWTHDDSAPLDLDRDSTTTNEAGSSHQPVMHVKMSEDLSELMIEVTSRNQKTVYKC